MRKLSTDEAFGRIKAKNPNIEILSKEYVSVHTKVSLRCKVCKFVWGASLSNLTNRHTGCPICSMKRVINLRKATKLSTNEAFGRIRAKHPNIEILSDAYEKNQGFLVLKCKVCSYRWQTTYNKLTSQGTGCPKCSGCAKPSTKEAFKNVREKHPSIQVLSRKYQNTHSLLSLKCRVCKHRWQATYTNLVHGGTRCPKCARKMTKGEKHIFDLLISCGLVYCSSLEEALAHEKRRLKCVSS